MQSHKPAAAGLLIFIKKTAYQLAIHCLYPPFFQQINSEYVIYFQFKNAFFEQLISIAYL